MRLWVEWILLSSAGVVMGLGAAWAENGFIFPPTLVEQALIVALFMAAAYAGWTAYRYYTTMSDDDQWD